MENNTQNLNDQARRKLTCVMLISLPKLNQITESDKMLMKM